MSKKQKNPEEQNDPRRRLPSMTALLEAPVIQSLIEEHSRPVVMDTIRETLSKAGREIAEGMDTPEAKDIVVLVEAHLAREAGERLRTVVNAAGIVLHTGLGRAPLAAAAAKTLGGMDQCCNMQIDMETGLRGRRNYTTQELLCRLTGAEAAMVVNNNAGATFLILAALCHGMEVVISRGQLIEIGGSFRLHDCIRQSGAVMKEVGTTNKTHLRDYESALSENTAAILRVFPSNYRVIGFTKSVSIAELSTLKEKQPFILIDDLGCGALVDLSKYGLPKEPTVPESIADGADIICSSGDKLIGGPQAGIIVGRKDLIARIKKHPLSRMLRICKLSDIALQQTLELFLEPETLLEKHPTLRMMTMPLDRLKRRAQRLKSRLEKAKPDLQFRVAEGQSAVGGGTMPDHPIPTYVVALASSTHSPERLAYLLRRAETPVVSRISDNEVVLDMRTLLDGEDRIIEEAVKGLPDF